MDALQDSASNQEKVYIWGGARGYGSAFYGQSFAKTGSEPQQVRYVTIATSIAKIKRPFREINNVERGGALHSNKQTANRSFFRRRKIEYAQKNFIQ